MIDPILEQTIVALREHLGNVTGRMTGILEENIKLRNLNFDLSRKVSELDQECRDLVSRISKLEAQNQMFRRTIAALL